jgi:hypothetical protein
LFTTKQTVSLQLGLTCVNPTSAGAASGVKVQATFYTSSQAAILPVCAGAGGTVGWSPAIPVVFPANSPTAYSPDLTATQLHYPDVGILQLSVSSSGIVYATRLVSQPARLSFVDIKSGQLSNPDNLSPQPGFIPAGETFTVRVRAENATSGKSGILYPPNFGNESPAAALTVGQDTPPAMEPTFASPVDGIATGQMAYAEAGYVKLTPLMATPGLDYMGSGVPVPGAARTVGRFYPAYFTTAVTSPFECQASMTCPSGKLASGADTGVSGAVYSGQPFNVQVTPYNKANDPITKYGGAVTLLAVTKPGPDGVEVAAQAGTFTVPVAPAALADGSGVYSANPVFSLPKVFDPANTHATWTLPTAIYLRAQAQETVVASSGTTTTTATITSRDGVGRAPEEDGVQVVVGRMQVSNAFGSELIKLKVPVVAQYWSGGAWDNNIGDNTSGLGPAKFTNCTGKFSTGTGPANCDTNLLNASPPPSLMTDGGADVFVNAPGRGNTGSGMMSVFKSGQPWLPTLPGKVVFGIARSPVIYIREVY